MHIGKPLPLQEPYELDTLDLSHTQMDPGHVLLLSWWLGTDAGAALNSIALDGCVITGTTFGTGYGEQQGGHNEKIEKLDANLSGFNSFCLALKSSQIASLSLRKCYLGPEALTVLADATKFMAALNSITLDGCLITGTKIKNQGKWDEEIEQLDADLSGFTSLCSSLQSSHIETLSFQNCYLGPDALKLLADAIKLMAALASVNFSGNPLTGATYYSVWESWENIDSNLAGFIALCSVLGKLNEVNLSDCHLGPASVVELAKVFSDADAARLTLKENRGIGASGADPLMESICSTRNTCIVSIEHDVGALV